MNEKSIVGCLLGTAVGDALGLPYEGLSPDRARRLLGPPTRYRFLFGRGMISDDTEHTCMVAQSLIEAGDDTDRFTRRFARRLRWWILAFPAGVGKATARSGIKLWLGIPPHKAGVFSAGNGPSMRAAILGATTDDHDRLLDRVRASTRLTHTDPRAHQGAVVIALAAQVARQEAEPDARRWLDRVVASIGPDAEELVELLQQALDSVRRGEATPQFAASLGLRRGVTGYTYHTVPVCIHAWLANPRDFREAVSGVIACGGDADTTAAIVGGIVGSAVGRQGIPDEWVAGLWEWPRSVAWMEKLGRQAADTLSTSQAGTAPRIGPGPVIARNLLFLAVVLGHGFRRLAPPY